nr:hypothetical protein CFP56_64733 [Quercus suber]
MTVLRCTHILFLETFPSYSCTKSAQLGEDKSKYQANRFLILSASSFSFDSLLYDHRPRQKKSNAIRKRVPASLVLAGNGETAQSTKVYYPVVVPRLSLDLLCVSSPQASMCNEYSFEYPALVALNKYMHHSPYRLRRREAYGNSASRSMTDATEIECPLSKECRPRSTSGPA